MGGKEVSPVATSPPQLRDWKTSFHNVIQKLSLTDASKEGFQSTKAIVGREKEMNQVLSFLRNALNGSTREGHRSLFIAGPVSPNELSFFIVLGFCYDVLCFLF
jgi:hypothetical protein